MSNSSRLEFKIQGLDCAEEISILKRAVGPVVGGEDRLGFDVINARMIVHGATEGINPDAVIAAVANTGMRAESWRADEIGDKGLMFWARWGRTILAGSSGVAVGIGSIAHFISGWDAKPGYAVETFYFLAMLTGPLRHWRWSMPDRLSSCFGWNKVGSPVLGFGGVSTLFTPDLMCACPWEFRTPWSCIVWSTEF